MEHLQEEAIKQMENVISNFITSEEFLIYLTYYGENEFEFKFKVEKIPTLRILWRKNIIIKTDYSDLQFRYAGMPTFQNNVLIFKVKKIAK